MVPANGGRELNEHTNISKQWGSEEWFANNSLYCGKMLIVKEGEWSSGGRYHYHKIKDETFFVLSGSLVLLVLDPDTEVIMLREGDSYRVKPGIKHKFRSSGPECKFIEVSTHHSEDDSIRCYSEELDD